MTEKPGETVVEYAARRGVSRRTILHWIKRGLLNAVRKGYGPTSPYLITGESPVARAATDREPAPRVPPVPAPPGKGQPPSLTNPVREPREPHYISDPDIDQRPFTEITLTETERDLLDQVPYPLSSEEITHWLTRYRERHR